MASSGMRSMESKHKPIVILRCKIVIVGKLSWRAQYQIINSALNDLYSKLKYLPLFTKIRFVPKVMRVLVSQR